jgi:hypothetical protein
MLANSPIGAGFGLKRHLHGRDRDLGSTESGQQPVIHRHFTQSFPGSGLVPAYNFFFVSISLI